MIFDIAYIINMNKGQSGIIIYKPPGKLPVVEVKHQIDDLWLNLNDLCTLFQRDKSVISRHINNILKTGELKRISVVANFATTATDGKTYQVTYYNLDMIISVGYRINSKVGTHFRIWATSILKDYSVKGYALNIRRLHAAEEKLDELTRSIRLIGTVAQNRDLSGVESEGLLKIITDYAYGLETLDNFDRRTLKIQSTSENMRFILDYHTARKSINEMKIQLSQSGVDNSLFGIEKDDSLEGSLRNIHQSINGVDAYPSIEEKAAHLLYFIIKNHPFTDGNKRIAAALFLWFLDRNACLYNVDGTKRIADNALVALTLMVAESDPSEMELIIKVIINLINLKN